jgi:hypothetical protein
MTSENYGEMTLMFESVVVKDSNSNTTKDFRDVSIEVAGKDIFIGSSYKIKSKYITALKFKNDVDGNNDDEEDGADSSRFLQEYRDSDYQKAGFELVCARDTKRKSKQHGMSFQQLDPEDTETGDFRTFYVRFPVPPDGQRFAWTFWEAFRKTLEGVYKKERNKRQKKKDRERAKRDEELQQQQDLRRKSSSFSRARSSRTYSRRPYDFMRKNAANIASNAEVWTDDEEEGSGDMPARHTTPELVPLDDVAEVAGPVDDGVEIDESKKHEANTQSESDKIDDENSGGAVEEGNRTSTVEGEDNDNDDLLSTSNDENLEEDDIDSSMMRLATKFASSSKRRRIKRRAPVLDDSEDEDDNLFHNTTARLTTPATKVQRVVTPGMAKATIGTLTKLKAKRFLEDDGDDDYDEGKAQGKEQDHADETDEEASVENNRKINSFFQPRPKTTSIKNGQNVDSSGAVMEGAMSTVVATSHSDDKNPNNDEIHENPRTDSVIDKLSNKDFDTTPTASTSKTMNSFFARRSKTSFVRPMTKTPTTIKNKIKKKRTQTTTKSILDNDDSDSDETSTVVAGAHISDVKDEILDNVNNTDNVALSPATSPALRAHSPKQSRMNFQIVRTSGSRKIDGRRSIDEEDPIETADSSQSQSPSKRPSSSLTKRSSRFADGRLSDSIKRRRLRINGSRSALEALEFADTKAQRLRSPLSMPRSNEGAVSTKVKAAGGRSPIQPLQLGPQVERAATELPIKWKGIRNDGNSCYVNSSLQQLFSVPQFMRAIASRKEGHELVATLSNLYSDLMGTGGVGESVSNRYGTVSARPVKKVMDRLTNRFNGCQQRDAHEFLGELIDQIHEELSPPSTGKEGEDKKNKENDMEKRVEPTDEYFRWNVQVCLKCKKCGYSR